MKSRLQAGRSGPAVIAYTASGCLDCLHLKDELKRLRIPFAEIDIEETEAASSAMLRLNGGVYRVPTVVIEGSNKRYVLVEPSDEELASTLAIVVNEPPATSLDVDATS